MARLKEYDRQDVLQKASELFWLKGFEATSMSELVQATGLNSASMYKEFGNKEGLFDSALQDYQKTRLEPFLKILQDQPDMKGIEKFLGILVSIAQSPDFKGCLMMNTLSEEHSVSPAALRRVDKFCVKLNEALAAAIRGAQKEGSIPRKKDPVILAEFIICFIHGMVLYGRVGGHKAYVGPIVDTLKAALRT